MASLTSVIRHLEPILKDIKKQRKMIVPLDCRSQDLMRRLSHCPDHLEFDQWHRKRLDWVYHQAQNENLESLCKEVAFALHSAVLKAQLLQYHIMRQKPLPPRYWSARHILMSALGDILSAFYAFRVVNKEPDLNDVHINRAMVLVYLQETFRLMFLFEKLLSPEAKGSAYFRLWEECLDELNFEDFIFDNGSEYSQLDCPQLEDTNLAGTFPDPEHFPGLCLPHYPSRPKFVLNNGPYGASILPNLLSPQ
jgi:hypothetical protein